MRLIRAPKFIRNVVTTATIANIVVGSTASVLAVSNDDRIALWVSNLSNRSVAVRFLAAATDATVFKGIVVPGGETIKVIGDGDIYTGEVSIIGDGVTLDVSSTEI